MSQKTSDDRLNESVRNQAKIDALIVIIRALKKLPPDRRQAVLQASAAYFGIEVPRA